jgi:sugar O-acyltransferase (sialic acid O-acetyltransferase NeuD family)
MSAHAGVAILGYHDGAAGQVASWFEAVTGETIACFVHESPEPLTIDAEVENRKRVSQRVEYAGRESFMGRPLIVSLDWLEELARRGVGKVLPLTPDNRTRLAQIAACRDAGLDLVSAIHPTATVLPEAVIEPGVWINAGSLIGYKAQVAAGVIVNTGAQIDHHNVLEACCQIDPGVVTAGFVTVRSCAHVHAGAVIINRCEIAEDAVVGAGAVVIGYVPAKATVVGVPAKPVLKPGQGRPG